MTIIMKIEIRGPRQISYSLLIMGEQERALMTAEQLLSEQAKLTQVFFYGEAVNIAAATPTSMLVQRWLALQQQYALTLWLCQEALIDWKVVRADQQQALLPGFMLGSLGQFAQGCYHSDYLLSFGVADAA